MKPSDAELNDLLCQMDDGTRYLTDARRLQIFRYLIDRERLRRAAPASVPAELVERLRRECTKLYPASDFTEEDFWRLDLQDFANKIAAAYGREPAQQCEHGKLLKWAYSKLKFTGFSKQKDVRMLDQLKDAAGADK